jgi:hypothetical protein
MIPHCQYHVTQKMKQVEGPRIKMHGKFKKPTHKYYKCRVDSCPCVAAVEIPLPAPKPKRAYGPRRKTPNQLWNPAYW